jgi:hypothetical protein
MDLRAEPAGDPEGLFRGLLWLGEGSVLWVGGRAVENPMIYCSAGSVNLREASCVYTRLSVSEAEPAGAEKAEKNAPLGYWPSYSVMRPRQRALYLRWLASGKREPVEDIGYVFVYFYGLERRALLDGRDTRRVAGEVERLLGLYGASRSFGGYASRLLLYLHAKMAAEDPAEELPDLERLRRLPRLKKKDDVLFRLVLACCARGNLPLSAGRAFEAAARLWPSLEGGARAFARGFPAKYPDGLPVSARKTPGNAVSYIAVSGTLAFGGLLKSPPPVPVPDVLGKISQFKDLRSLLEGSGREGPKTLEPPEGVFGGLAQSPGAVVLKGGGGDEFVVARPAIPGGGSEPLPLVPVDMERVAALREETEALARDLDAVFSDEAEPDERDAGPERPEEPEGRCREFVPLLLRRASWSRADFSALARSLGVMPNALLEDVNTWSEAVWGDFLLLEDGDGWRVNADLAGP